MTEAEWLASNDPDQMLRFMGEKHGANRTKAGRRKMRLFGCASCRQLWGHMADPRSRYAVEVAERLADGQLSETELEDARMQAMEARRAVALRIHERTFRRELEPKAVVLARGMLPDDDRTAAQAAAAILEPEAGNFAWAGLTFGCTQNCAEYPIVFRRRSWEAGALRCLFGNPFRSVKTDLTWLAWNGGAIPKIAETMYDDRAFDRIPLLADALEDAGCTDADILAHCRDPGPHVRGCWVIDLLLGKT